MTKKFSASLLVPVLLGCSYSIYAATAIDLSHQPVSKIQAMIQQPISHRLLTAPGPQGVAATGDQLKELKRTVDFNRTTHIRVQQTHDGFPVWGADAVIHVPKSAGGVAPQGLGLANLAVQPEAAKTEMNGVVFDDLNVDLQGASKTIFTEAKAQLALQETHKLAKQYSKGEASKEQYQLMVFVDQDQKAHWAFLTSVYVPAAKGQLPAKPTFILDAETLKVYKQWNDVQAAEGAVEGGGFGGNATGGKLVYDGLKGDLGKLSITRNKKKKLCSLKNDSALVVDYRATPEATDKPATFSCKATDASHNNVYWDGDFDTVNGGFSPGNDALYAGSVVQALYRDWVGKPMLVKTDGSPMKLTLITHAGDEWENAVWDAQQQIIFLGDGADRFYPLTSLGVIAHEVSHGFTQQNSGLIYEGQSGGMNEAFSDMAAQAAEGFAYGKPSWQIGSEISKTKGGFLRDMEHPSKDCTDGSTAGDGSCSIENVSEYNERTNVHYTSGIYNRVFYLLSTASNWDVKKAFQVMAHANQSYWTSIATFKSGACGVVKSAKDFNYDLAGVTAAFSAVGIDTSSC